jgi:hypothetical protein
MQSWISENNVFSLSLSLSLGLYQTLGLYQHTISCLSLNTVNQYLYSVDFISQADVVKFSAVVFKVII